MSKLTNLLLAVILVVVAINLVMTSILLNRQAADRGAGDSLDPGIARNWGEQVVVLYNRRDHEVLYTLFHSQARVKISQQQLAGQLQKLHQLFGNIDDHAYVNAVKLGEKASASYYQLFFNARVGSKDSPATLKLSLVVEKDVISLYGLSINASESLD
ncbi:MAG: hypothetical protein GY785_06905 [Gammaproteobacteria bacterium]|nr:hypothetical protein [Gammaproteobacteria bacterium]